MLQSKDFYKTFARLSLNFYEHAVKENIFLIILFLFIINAASLHMEISLRQNNNILKRKVDIKLIFGILYSCNKLIFSWTI